MRLFFCCLTFILFIASCAVEWTEFPPTPTPIPDPVREAQEREFTERGRIAADLERERIAATAQAQTFVATVRAEEAQAAHATAIAPIAEATAAAQILQTEQSQASTTKTIVWGVIVIVAIIGLCIAVYMWSKMRIEVEYVRSGIVPPGRQLPSPEQWDVMQATAARRGQRLELQGNQLLLVDNQTGQIVRQKELP
jgi:hypothetical protein